MADLKWQFQALWLVLAALASIFTVVFIARIQSTAALSPECVPQCRHKCCHFPFAQFYKGPIEVLRLGTPHLISNEITPQLFVGPCRRMQVSAFCSLTCAFRGQFYPLPQTVAWQTHFASPLRDSASDFHISFFVHIRECADVITRQFKLSGEGGQQSVWCSLSQWVAMNNSAMSVWVPIASLDLIVFERRVHLRGLRSQCLYVCNPASVCLNTRCRLWNRIQM